MLIIRFDSEQKNAKLRITEWIMLILGSFILIISFTWEYSAFILQHYSFKAIWNAPSEDLLKLLGEEYNELFWTQLQKVPFILHLPGQKTGETITSACGQIDIYPTLANILGFKPFTIGRDLFNTNKNFAILK